MQTLHWDSINPATGQPYTWDDPNLRWGDPSYILEPGDPGYVPGPNQPPPSTQKPKKRNMAKHDYIQQNNNAFSAQLTTFKNGIGGYATTLGVTAAQVASQAADAIYFAYLLACLDLMEKGAAQFLSWRNLVRGGGTPPPTGAPLLPVFPTAVAAVLLGIEVRFRALVVQIKAHPNYNVAIGEALGIEGAVQTGPDLSAVQPAFKLKLSGGAVKVGWGWGGNGAFLDMLELEVDRADGKGFVFLTYDTTPGYNDTAPQPATPTKWKYRGIYRVGDARVGQWSNEVAINVGGN